MAIVLPFMERHEVDTLGITSRNGKNNKIGQIILVNAFIVIIIFMFIHCMPKYMILNVH
jgi:hypothetical protein